MARIPEDPSEYLVKFRGAEILDGMTVSGAGIVPNGELIVLRRRRRAVRA